jgi:N-methylhydantoinase B/oxoprolinase/acetone carboxylase alpha subunit
MHAGKLLKSVNLQALRLAAFTPVALGAPIWAANCVGRRDDGSQYGSVQNFHGGQGARAEFDGLDTLSFPSNCKVTAIEMLEIAVPVVTECKELIADSGGAGKTRGASASASCCAISGGIR